MRNLSLRLMALFFLPVIAHGEVTGADVPRYQTLVPQKGAGEAGAGEFNIGYNPHTHHIMTFSNVTTYRVTLPEYLAEPLPESCDAVWEDVSAFVTGPLVGFDPILWLDQPSGRTLTSNWTGGADLAYAYSDDDGATWVQAGIAAPNGGLDHQTIGTGPYPAGSPFALISQAVGFGNATYYCSQNDPPAFCQRSDDGGMSYGPGVPIYNGSTGDACHGLHGHIHVAPDGTAYVPSGTNCSGKQGGALSTDAGVTWNEFEVPGTVGNDSVGSDPSVGIDADNTAYYCYVQNEVNGGGRVHVAVSRDRGATWTDDIDIGAPFGILNAAFPEATVGGDSGRAACGFLGTTEPGDWQSLDNFHGVWYLYIATTYDGGRTWTTVNATPNDPVQGWGGIWLQGGGQKNRNLLDFNEVTIDEKGRVLFGYDKGCVDACVTDPSQNTFVGDQRIARQTGGKTLLSQFDPAGATAPAAPCLSASSDDAGVHLAWKAPDTGGTDITGYRVYRGTAPGQETFLSQSGSQLVFDDAGTGEIWYRVTAVNSMGEGVASNEVSVTGTGGTSPGTDGPPAAPVDANGRFGGMLSPALLFLLSLGGLLRARVKNSHPT